MMKLFTVIWLLILSDGVAAFVGARAAWALRAEDHRRFELAVALSFGLMSYSAARFSSVVNSIYHVTGAAPANSQLYWSIVNAALQSLGMWVIALTLMNGRAPGRVRRALTRALNLAR